MQHYYSDEKREYKAGGSATLLLNQYSYLYGGREIQPTSKYLGKPVETRFYNEVPNVADIYWAEAAVLSIL